MDEGDEISPGDPEAHRALGRVEHDGQWVSEEESFKAQGFVKFEGEWMTPGNGSRSSRTGTPRMPRRARRSMPRFRRRTQAAAERQAQKQAEDDAYWQGVPTYGDPLYCDSWGVAPMYWPSTPGRDLTGEWIGRIARPTAGETGGRIR